MATQSSHFKKTKPAFMAALGMTSILALFVVSFGLNALLNQNTVPVQVAASSGIPALTGQETSQQLKDQITQYQAQLQQAANQVSQLNQANQAYQNVLNYLQDAGVIQVAPNGQITLKSNTGGVNAPAAAGGF